MNEFLQFALLGVGFGALYALAAQGVVLIYRGSGTINFAQGAMGMIGAFVYYSLHYHPAGVGTGVPTARWGFWPTLAVGVATSALLGLLTYVLVMRPLRNASPLARLVGTLGVLVILTSLAATGPSIAGLFDWGSSPISLPSFYPLHVFDFGGGVVLSHGSAIVLAVTAGLTLVLWLVYRLTTFGIATTAVAENQRAASALGWSPDVIAGVNWALGAGLAGLAGVLIIPFFGGIERDHAHEPRPRCARGCARRPVHLVPDHAARGAVHRDSAVDERPLPRRRGVVERRRESASASRSRSS